MHLAHFNRTIQMTSLYRVPVTARAQIFRNYSSKKEQFGNQARCQNNRERQIDQKKQNMQLQNMQLQMQMSTPQCTAPTFMNPNFAPWGCPPVQTIAPPSIPPPSVVLPSPGFQASMEKSPVVDCSTEYGLPPEGNPAWYHPLQPCTCGGFHSTAERRNSNFLPGGCCSNYYDKRKFCHQLSPYRQDDACAPPFFPLPEFPVGIFRNTSFEQLGPCAAKNAVYKSPEYYAYHHMSYYDLHLNLRRYRIPAANANIKR